MNAWKLFILARNLIDLRIVKRIRKRHLRSDLPSSPEDEDQGRPPFITRECQETPEKLNYVGYDSGCCVTMTHMINDS